MDLRAKRLLSISQSTENAILLRLLLLLLFAASPVHAGFSPRTLAGFGLDFAFGSGVIQGADGNLYGIAQGGGNYGLGEAFKITPKGKVTPLASFTSIVSSGEPFGNLIQGSDGNFYGTGTSGGTNGDGALFCLSPSGALTVVAAFDNSNGIEPGPLMQGTDGNFYGVTTEGGTNGAGNVYEVTPERSCQCSLLI